ncbi:hypothetical protein [Devosia sp.]|uniref:hypothetical protein n=1 Tax=Devosia sp. TaxID=1871048 RepID=UPI003BACC848
MSAYLFVYHGGATPEGDEAEAASLEAWNAWMESIDDQLIDGGNPVGESKVLNADGSVGEAPANRVSGYSIVVADDMDGALELARNCPVFAEGGNVEVAELLDMGLDLDEDEEE